MRYSSGPIFGLTLFRENGSVATLNSLVSLPLIQFFNNVLDLGSTGGATVEIEPNLAATDGTALQIINADGSTDLEKVGLNKYFWEAPEITAQGATPAASWVYDVISGTVTYHSIVYHAGDQFVGTGSGTTTSADGGIIAKFAPTDYAASLSNYFEGEAFKIVHLEVGDEATWDISEDIGYDPPSSFGWIRTS